MKYLIVGLGNPGEKYENTRHNIGFRVLDAFLKDLPESFEVNKLGNTAKVKFKGRTLILLQPSTFMNLSGKAVNYWMQQEKIPLENVLIITDDLALPYGKLRLKGKGSDGGHNGLKDIIATFNTNTFARLRFGVSSDFAKGRQVDYVLSNWSQDELDLMENHIKSATEFIRSFTTIGIERTMNFLNKK